MSRKDEDEARLARDVTARAIRRLDILEWASLGVAVALAIVGGWLIAFLLVTFRAVPFAFRSTWITTSLALFLVSWIVTRWRARAELTAFEARRNAMDDESHV